MYLNQILHDNDFVTQTKIILQIIFAIKKDSSAVVFDKLKNTNTK